MKKYLVDVDIKRGKIKPKYKYIQIEIVVYTFKLYLFKRNTKANKKHWLNIISKRNPRSSSMTNNLLFYQDSLCDWCKNRSVFLKA